MENRYGTSYGQESSVMNKNEEFQEEDVWGLGVFKEITWDSDRRRSSPHPPSFTSKGLLPSAAATTTIPKSNKINHNKYSQLTEPKIEDVEQHHYSSSAPVNIPDWSKIYGNYGSNSSTNASTSTVWNKNIVDDHDGFATSGWEISDDEEDEEEEDEYGNITVIPPHEWIARKLARNHISSFSVCEGAGRTLKGRDLSRVRNAVLTKTGFLESKN